MDAVIRVTGDITTGQYLGVTLGGVVFPSIGNQACVGYVSDETYRVSGGTFTSYAGNNSSVLYIEWGASVTGESGKAVFFSLVGIQLAAEPTWASLGTTWAQIAETPGDVYSYIPMADAQTAGLLSTVAQTKTGVMTFADNFKAPNFKPYHASAAWQPGGLTDDTSFPASMLESLTNTTLYTTTFSSNTLTITFINAGYYNVRCGLGHTHSNVFGTCRMAVDTSGTSTIYNNWDTAWAQYGIGAEDSNGYSEITYLVYATAGQTIGLKATANVTAISNTTQHNLYFYATATVITLI